MTINDFICADNLDRVKTVKAMSSSDLIALGRAYEQINGNYGEDPVAFVALLRELCNRLEAQPDPFATETESRRREREHPCG